MDFSTTCFPRMHQRLLANVRLTIRAELQAWDWSWTLLNVAAIPWQRAKTLHLTWFNGIFLLFHNFYEQGKGRRLREKHSVSGREDQIKGKSHVYSAILVFIVLSIVRRERSSYDLGSIWHFRRRTSPITFQERAAGFGEERWAECMNHITSKTVTCFSLHV